MRRDEWFANWGQIIQAILALLACIFGGVKAWPEMKANAVLSFGAILFYVLIALVVVSFWIAITKRPGASRQPQDVDPGMEAAIQSVTGDFAKLPWPQQVAVRIIHGSPNGAIHLADLGRRLGKMGFVNVGEIDDSVIHSDFAERDFMGYIKPVPRTAGAVRKMLERIPVLPDQ